jgi:hypothetical protein
MRRLLAHSAAVLAAVIFAAGIGTAAAIAAGSNTTTTAAATATGTSPASSSVTTPITTSTPTTPITTTTPTTTTTTTTTPPPPPPAAKGKVKLYLLDAFVVHHNEVTVPGRTLHVGGVVRPWIPGQWVTVQAYVGHRLFKNYKLRIKPSSHHRYGRFTAKMASPKAGIVRVKVLHLATPQQLGFFGQRAVAALNTSTHFGARGPFVSLMQDRLMAVHMYLPPSGVYDLHMALAVDAYHRLLGWGHSQQINGRTVSALLNGWGTFVVRHPHDGVHVEGNLSKQLLALIYGKRVYRIYPISSGKPSTPTVLGHFHVYTRTPGYLPDGMYFSSFFYRGYAIHGYDPAPDYPASHGCMRVPITDAISIYDWLNYGNVVDVYY